MSFEVKVEKNVFAIPPKEWNVRIVVNGWSFKLDSPGATLFEEAKALAVKKAVEEAIGATRPSTPTTSKPASSEPARSDDDLVEALCAIEDGLTEWESDFVQSVSEQFEVKGWLSEKQRAVCERILEEKGS